MALEVNILKNFNLFAYLIYLVFNVLTNNDIKSIIKTNIYCSKMLKTSLKLNCAFFQPSLICGIYAVG